MAYKIHLGVGWRGGYEVINGVGKKKTEKQSFFFLLVNGVPMCASVSKSRWASLYLSVNVFEWENDDLYM